MNTNAQITESDNRSVEYEVHSLFCSHRGWCCSCLAQIQSDSSTSDSPPDTETDSLRRWTGLPEGPEKSDFMYHCKAYARNLGLFREGLNSARDLKGRWSFFVFVCVGLPKDTYHPLCFQISCFRSSNTVTEIAQRGRKERRGQKWVEELKHKEALGVENRFAAGNC